MTNEGRSVNLHQGWTNLMLVITKERVFCVDHLVSLCVLVEVTSSTSMYIVTIAFSA